MMLKPSMLREGDRIAVVAPASPFERSLFDQGIAELRSLGLDPVFDDAVFERNHYLAGSAADRARAFESAWADPRVAGLIGVRGGYGSAQLLPLLDRNTLRRRPKVVLGSSDLTSVLSFLTLQCGVVGFHGPMVVSMGRGRLGYDQPTLVGQLMQAQPFGDVALDRVEVLKGGQARGLLLGGTLTQLVASLGTPFPFEPPAGFVLLLDDVGERPYRIDRMLTQLQQAGVLARASAVLCAEFPECDEPDGAVTARSILASLLADIAGPVLFGVPTGHTVRPMVTLPLGVDVTVDATHHARIIIEEAAVA